MLFGGKDAVAVDKEIFKRAGLNPKKSRFLDRVVAQLSDGQFPEYVVKGDEKTLFKDICDWENVTDKVVEGIDCLEEVYIGWGFINLKAISKVVDYTIFPTEAFFTGSWCGSLKNSTVFLKFSHFTGDSTKEKINLKSVNERQEFLSGIIFTEHCFI
jgi:hypothetical protein